MFRSDPFDETEKMPQSVQLKSSLAKFSENLSYFDREGRKIAAIKKNESDLKIIKTDSIVLKKTIELSGRIKSIAKERQSRPLSSKRNAK